MRISWGCHVDIDKLSNKNGYGYATARIVESLRRLGHEVAWNDKSADVHIHFDQPQHLDPPSKDIYTISYMPWESTRLQPLWAEAMNSCDEVWTPSPLIASWFTSYAGITRPVFVFEHGVDSVWAPKKREFSEPFTFLHVGGEALRKGGKETMTAFRKAFPGNVDVRLNMKIISQGWGINILPRINIINHAVPLDELINLYHDNHVFVYPSYGEGFGMNPLQAMATGMPTITVPDWAPYARFLDYPLGIRSKMVESPWQRVHPGKMLMPNQNDLVESMRYVYQNYETVSERAYARVGEITDYYSWDKLTKTAFDDLAIRLKNS